MSRICILGGGFGGLYTALELSRQLWRTPPQITLVDRSDRFVFLPLLYELLTGEMEDWEVAPRYQDLLVETTTAERSCPVHFQQGTVQAIDAKNRRVTLQEGSSLDYDCLVLALGGETALERVPGAAEYAFPFRYLPDAQRLKMALNTWETKDPQEPIRIAIAGAGASGVELACKLADRLGSRGQIRLIEMGSLILPAFTSSSRATAEQALQQRQIQFELNTQVLQVTQNSLQTQQQGSDAITSTPVDGVIWTVGTQPAAVIRSLPLAQNSRQRLVVNPTLQTGDHPEIFALGDLAAVIDANGQPVPATAQAAFQQAGYCAWNVWAWVTQERPLLPFRYQPLGEMLSLGIDTALLSGLGITLTGSLGYLARRTVYLARLPTLDHQLKVGWNWMTKPLISELQRWLKPASG